MKKEVISGALERLDGEYIDDFLATRHRLAEKSRRKKLFMPIAAALICTAVVCGAIFLPPLLKNNSPDVPPVTDTDDSSDTEEIIPPSNPPAGTIITLDSDVMTSTAVNGCALKYTGSIGESEGDGAPPAFAFESTALVVAVQAVELLPDEYESLVEYGHTGALTRYLIYRMKIVDPLESGIKGELLYAIPSKLEGDLTEYNTLLISMRLTEGKILRNTTADELTSFQMLFFSSENDVLGNLIAFTDGIFDESLWKNESWRYGYQFAKHYLDAPDKYSISSMLVSRGATLEDAITNYRINVKEWQDELASRGISFDPSIKRYLTEYKTDEANAALDYVEPFKNGVFVQGDFTHSFRRYIGGCPTNEYVSVISYDGTEKVTWSEHRFDESDIEGLPDIAAYIDSLELEKIVPEHTDTTGKKLNCIYATGWYEKTDDGVYSIVKIFWRYYSETATRLTYIDEMFIILEEDGARIVSREELRSLIGENSNFYYGEYGAAEDIVYE